ncbi:MAG: glutathione S-transferase family protein [Gammaproteobacteria bacterium]|nr:glutathione S-transferase family protein [Gammaproteobacteria bacterium]
MALKIYGPVGTRTYRTLWMAEELGIDYEHITDATPEALVAVNPMAQVPAIDDDGFILTESMAINLYLARKHGKLMPSSAEEQAQTLRWCFWVMTAVEGTLLDVLKRQHGILGFEKDPDAVAAGIETLQRPLRVLNGHLADRDHLVNQDFTVADLNVASVLSWSRMARIDLSDHGNVDEWLGRCLERDAAVRARG